MRDVLLHHALLSWSGTATAGFVPLLGSRHDVVDPEEEDCGLNGRLVHLKLDGQGFVDAKGFGIFDLKKNSRKTL